MTCHRDQHYEQRERTASSSSAFHSIAPNNVHTQTSQCCNSAQDKAKNDQQQFDNTNAAASNCLHNSVVVPMLAAIDARHQNGRSYGTPTTDNANSGDLDTIACHLVLAVLND